MSTDRKETLVERAVEKLKEFAGLPPGRHLDGEPVLSDDSPRGTLTADDAEGLPPHKGTGTKPIE